MKKKTKKENPGNYLFGGDTLEGMNIVCEFCNKEWEWKRKDNLQEPLKCPNPQCEEWLEYPKHAEW